MKQSRKFAITGGIGSGKSYVLARIRERGYPVFSCDEISRNLWEEGEYRAALARLFPQCTQDGAIDKAKLSALVFFDPAQRSRLEQFSHPRIMQALFSRMDREAVSFAEVPLLFEGGYEGSFDGVIAVRRGEDARIRSVEARDGLSEQQVRLRMAQQLDPADLTQKPCDILENDARLEEHLDAILKKYDL